VRLDVLLELDHADVEVIAIRNVVEVGVVGPSIGLHERGLYQHVEKCSMESKRFVAICILPIYLLQLAKETIPLWMYSVLEVEDQFLPCCAFSIKHLCLMVRKGTHGQESIQN
jgi:hypothetical protein